MDIVFFLVFFLQKNIFLKEIFFQNVFFEKKIFWKKKLEWSFELAKLASAQGVVDAGSAGVGWLPETLSLNRKPSA